MTLPSKYRSWKTRQRIGHLVIGLIFAGIVGGLILLAAVSPKYVSYDTSRRMSSHVDYTIENTGPVLLVLFSILGVLVFLFFKLGAKTPAWRYKLFP